MDGQDQPGAATPAVGQPAGLGLPVPAALIQMAQHSGDLIALCNAEGQLTYLNPAGRRLIGNDEADIFPLRLTDYVVPEQRHRIDDEVIPVARAAGAWQGEMQLVNLKTGERIDVQRSTIALHENDGAISGFVSVMRDVTRTKAERRQLEQQAETFLSLIANNPFGVYLVDADFRLRVVSQGAQKVFENVRPLIGRDFAEVLRTIWTEPFASEAIDRFRTTLTEGTPYVSASTVEVRADVPVTEAYDWRIERITMPDGRWGVVCYFYDLSEREAWSSALARREAQLRELSADLENRVRLRTSALNAANQRLTAEMERREATENALVQSQKLEALGQLTSGIAHDFNNIMGAVLGGFSLISRRSTDPDVLKVVDMGKSASGRGAALVKQLMNFARAEDPVPQPIDVSAALGEVSALIRHALNRGVILRTDCPDDAWPTLADPAQFQSAILNLAINANDAMPAGGELSIMVRNSPGSTPAHLPDGNPPELAGRDAVRIVVADTGTGMDSKVLQRVMEPFFTTKVKGRGTGLGLAMVQGFVAQHGGAIRIESRPGEGTTFSLYLPRAAAADGSGAEAETGDRPGRERSAFETILMVDDDQDFLGMTAAAMADFGFEVVAVATAQEAIALLRTRAVDVLVSDVDLPGMDGFELVAHVRRTLPELPCLLMTGAAAVSDRAAQVVLRKPFRPEELRDAVLDCLTRNDRRHAEVERMDRLQARLQSDCARSLFTHWRALTVERVLPRIEHFDPGACSEPHRIVVAEVDQGRVPIAFRFTVIGETLAHAVSATVGAADISPSGTDAPATREAAYRRCALTGRPSYEFGRVTLEDNLVETFERLLLPFSADGETVDHIVGAVVIEQAPKHRNDTR